MMKVSNRKCVRRLGLRAMKAAKSRNPVAVLAIALTAMLFTSLFTIAESINYSFQQENFRQAGGDAHGSIKNITREQADSFREDPLIQDAWARLFVGMPHEAPFNKAHVEVSYIEPNGASHYFCQPVEGTLPREGTDEAATDTRVLMLLGVEPEIGTQFTIPIVIDDGTAHPQTMERTFTLSGWWEYDSAITADHVLLPWSAAEELCALSDGAEGTMTGVWNLDVMFKSAADIPGNLNAVLEHSGFQCMDYQAENYLNVGVNWGYTRNRVSENFDPATLLAIGAFLLLIVFTGYLIIYNVFRISVTNDIRFYGLLKTIGTTGCQIRRIVRQQALLLSLPGISLGLALGFVTGNKLTPVIMAQFSYKNAFVSFHPWIFIGAAVFSLLTVFLSCSRPGRLAAGVSPVEAVRYTEGSVSPGHGKQLRKAASGASLAQMAWANLGRSKGKTLVTVISLALGVVLMTLAVTFADGFDMEKYLGDQVCTDFVLGHADYFQAAGGSGFRSADQAVPEEVISEVSARGGVTEGGRVYGAGTAVQCYLPETYYRQNYSLIYTDEALDELMDAQERAGEDTIVGYAQLLGMEDFILTRLNVLEGDLSPLSDPAQNAVAAVYFADDYRRIEWDSNCFRVGDRVTLRYVEEWMYVDDVTGEELSAEEMDYRYDRGEWSYSERARVYSEADYTVCALVEVPAVIGYRYRSVGTAQLVMGAELFRQDTGMDSVMVYAFNTTPESNADMEDFLAEYTGTAQPAYDYESKQSKAKEFEGFRSMFLTVGSVLAGVIGLVGVLNFINAMLTGILARKRELAVLQSVGMTGKQLNTMLMYEGMYYAMLSAALALVLSAVLGPLAGNVCNDILWFFSYRFTVLPVVIITPIFAALGALIPLVVYRFTIKRSVVERLREAES